MKRSQRLTVVVELARRERDRAAGQFQACLAEVEAERRRLADLESYYGEYETQNGVGSTTASELMAHREFLQRLGVALGAQRQQVSRQENSVTQARQRWQRCHMKAQSLEDHVKKLQQEERKIAGQREDSLIADNFQSRYPRQQ